MQKFNGLLLREGSGILQGTVLRRRKLTGQTIKGTPPIWGFDRMGEKNELVHQVLYNKGPVLLYELEENVGYEEFVEFCSDLISNNISSTSELLKLLGSTNGKNVSESFEKKLKTR